MADKSDLDALDRLAATTPETTTSPEQDDGITLGDVWDMLGKVNAQVVQPDFEVLPGLQSRVAGMASVGVTDVARRLLGVPEPPPEGGPIAGGIADIIGGAIGGGPVGGALRAGAARIAPASVQAAAAAWPRAFRTVGGAAEGAAFGGTMAAMRGGSPDEVGKDAFWSAGGAAGIGAAGSALGWTGMRAARWMGKKRKIELIDPELQPLLEREGIPTTPVVLRPQGGWLEWVQERLARMASAKPYLEQRYAAIQKGFDDWRTRVFERLGPGATNRTNLETGEQLSDVFKTKHDELHAAGQSIYKATLDDGPFGQWAPKMDELADELQQIVTDYKGSLGPSYNRLVSLANRLSPKQKDESVSAILDKLGNPITQAAEPQSVHMSLKQLWREGSNLYPTKKNQWSDGDVAGSEAFTTVKEFIRRMGADPFAPDPNAAIALEQADNYWKTMFKLTSSPVGKTITRSNSDDLVNKLAASQTSIRQAREDYGDDFVRVLAQQKVKNIFNDSYKDAVGVVKGVPGRATRELDFQKLAGEMSKIGGKDNNMLGEYLDELFKGQPEVRKAVDEILNTSAAYQKGLQKLFPGEPGEGGGLLRWAVSTLVSLTAGAPMAKSFLRPPATNTWLGGNAPPDPGFGNVITQLRRGAVSGTQPIIGPPPPPVTAGTPDDSMSVLQQMPR